MAVGEVVTNLLRRQSAGHRVAGVEFRKFFYAECVLCFHVALTIPQAVILSTVKLVLF